VSVTVVMTSYWPEGEVGDARVLYAKQTLEGLLKYLQHEEGLRLHIADDGSAGNQQVHIRHMLYKASELWESIASVSDSEHHGIGASLNKALTALREQDNYWMYITDDWVLTRELNLDGPIKLMRVYGYDLVRLGPIHPDVTCVSRFSSDIGWWLDLHQHYGGFAFATRPFVATKDFWAKIGPFDENLNSYETERLYAERVAKWPVKLAYWGGVDLAGPWQHVGDVCVGYKEVEAGIEA